MSDTRQTEYAKELARLIRAQTVSLDDQKDRSVFYQFHDLLREIFPRLFEVCTLEIFDGSILLCWHGTKEGLPILLMNHHDVVEAPGVWRYPPFSGRIAEGRLWGRGTLDTKSGLWAMLRAAEELIAEGFTPENDVYFISTCTEETDGSGADQISKELLRRGIRFRMALDEGGMILEEPIGGAKGKFAMIGVGEKGCADLKFIARSAGGHASTPPKNTPLVRLGKFIAAAEKKKLFPAKLSPTVRTMLRTLSRSMRGPLRFLLGHPTLFAPLLTRVLPAASAAAGAMVKTTLAFTMAQGSDGANVLPQEAYVAGNMRYSHHQGSADSIGRITALARKYDVETVVLNAGIDSPITDCKGDGFALVAGAVEKLFPDVTPTPYVMNAASDSRFLCRVCDTCLRFTPFFISDDQMESVHGINESIDICALPPAVDFYRYIITEASHD